MTEEDKERANEITMKYVNCLTFGPEVLTPVGTPSD
jgi:hypothetical protein